MFIRVHLMKPPLNKIMYVFSLTLGPSHLFACQTAFVTLYDKRLSTLRNAVITVIWSIIENLEGVEAPAESAKPTKP
jgi:hypothetical protein